MQKKARKGRAIRRRRGEMLKAILREQGVRKGLWMLNVPTSFAELKGLVAEEKALRAFEYFQQRKVEFYQMGVITRVTPTIHYSEEDRKSIDLKVEFQSGESLFNEVKNRWSPELEERLREKNRCLIAIPWTASNEEAIERVSKAVNRFLEK